MKELFREPDFTRVSYFQSILEEEGIVPATAGSDDGRGHEV